MDGLRAIVTSVRPGVLAVLGALAVFAAPGATAWAQTGCPTDGGMTLPPDWMSVISQFPGQNETGVPIDGFIRLRYRGPVPRPPVMRVTDDTGAEVDGTAVVLGPTDGEELHWQSRQPLRPNTRYTATFRDVNSDGNTITFTTGTQFTMGEHPNFSGIVADPIPTVSLNGSSDICGDPNAVTITVQWRRADSNNWPASDIEYVIYQTAGPGVGASIERARERLFDPSGNCPSRNDLECRSFRLPSSAAGGPVCFNIQALDAYGRNDGNTVQACTDPTVGNYWVGAACDVGSRPVGAPAASIVPRRGSHGGWVGLGSALALLAVGLAWRVRRSGR